MTLNEQLADYAAYLEVTPERMAASIRNAHSSVSDRTTVIFSSTLATDICHIRRSDRKEVMVRLYRWASSDGPHWAMGYEAVDDVLYIYDERIVR